MISTIIYLYHCCHLYRKGLEKTVFIQIFKYFTINTLQYVNQYGFRVEYSTEVALTELIDRIYLHLNENKLPIAIFIDKSILHY